MLRNNEKMIENFESEKFHGLRIQKIAFYLTLIWLFDLVDRSVLIFKFFFFALDFWQQGRWEVSFIFLHFLVNQSECRISLCVLHNLGLLLLEVLNFRVSLYGRGTISRFDYNSDWKFCLINGLCYWGMFSLYKNRFSLDTGNFLIFNF